MERADSFSKRAGKNEIWRAERADFFKKRAGKNEIWAPDFPKTGGKKRVEMNISKLEKRWGPHNILGR